MNGDKDPAPNCGRLALTTTQRSRIHFAQRDLSDARCADLAGMPPADLVLLVERLRGRLDDALHVVEELAG